MTDYSSLKVTDLKAELKRRGIPQTGLRVKQNFIDKLQEDDSKAQGGGVPEEPTAAQDTIEQGEAQQLTTDVASEPAKPEVVEPEELEKEGEQKAQNAAVDEKETPTIEKGAEEQPEQPEQPSQQTQLDKSSKESQEARDQSKPIDSTDSTIPETEAPAKPVEHAPGNAEARQPISTEPSESANNVAPQGLGAATGMSTPLLADEIIEDRRKRKRRSQSPVPTPQELAKKKQKAQDEAPEVLLREDTDTMTMGESTKEDTAVPGPLEPSGDRANDHIPQEEETDQNKQDARRASISEELRVKKGVSLKQDGRFKDLFTAPAEREQARLASPPADTVLEEAEVEPALHSATAALYVDGLMRPLQPGTLKNHIVSVASAPGSLPDPDVITDFYLDPIKTHCFVSFTNISAASRARSALHGNIWPNERNRKALFVDFIPEQKLQQWVATEEESRKRSGPPTRWEVKYGRTDDGVEAVLREVDPKSATSHQAPARESSDFSRPPPLGPRASIGGKDRRPGGPPPPEPRPRPGQGFKPLDELFESTTTKPKLYYLPVSREIADRRLDRFDDLLRKGSFSRPGGDETRRISFEDGDVFVDNGPEYGGGRNRRRGGRGRRGGFGDSWRDDRAGRP